MKLSIAMFKLSPKQTKGLECLNCGQPLSGKENFCSYCGQKNTIKKLNLGTFFNNLFSGFLSYDSRFWKTFIPLIIKPGKVSKDYISGKRVRFVNPFQLYLNVSIVFFLILGISNRINKAVLPVNEIAAVNQTLDSLKEVNQTQIDSIIKNVQNEVEKNSPNDSTATKTITNIGDIFKLTTTEDNSPNTIEKPHQYHIKTETTESINLWKKIEDFQNYYTAKPNLSNNMALDSLGYKKTFWNTFYYQQIINSNKNYKQFKEDGGKQFVNKLFSYISISLFIFLPLFTFFLMLVYWRKKYTYIEHLVFVFNTQTVFFLLLSIFFLIDFFINLENVAGAFILLFIIYLYKALRNFYQQRRAKTIIKFILLNSFYMLLALIGIIIVGAISFVSS